MVLFNRRQILRKPAMPPSKGGSRSLASSFSANQFGRSPAKLSPPFRPKTLFEEEKSWERRELLRRISQSPHRYKTPGGRTLSVYEERKQLEQAFPSKRFGSRISESEVKKRLRELRTEEYRAKTWDEKERLGRLRDYLEKETGLKGKY